MLTGLLSAIVQCLHLAAEDIVDVKRYLQLPWQAVADRGRGVEGIGVVGAKLEIRR